MSTPDKCPHCGALREPPTAFRYLCGSGYEGRGVVCYVSELAATKRELEEVKQKFSDAEDQVIGGGYATQMLRKHCGLDDTKEDLMEVAELVATLKARVAELEQVRTSLELHKSELRIANARILTSEARAAELEGLELGSETTQNRGSWIEVFIPSNRINTKLDEGTVTTLGQAMPGGGK